MRILLLLSTFVMGTMAAAQQVEDVINAEKSFAAYAKGNNTRDAFLNFMDSNAVLFNEGQVLNAKKLFSEMKPSTSKLLWQPSFAGIALSGNLGFTTGPYESRSSLTNIISYSGAFSTIWHKTSDGQWKFLVDMGVVLGKAPMPTPSVIKVSSGKESAYQQSAEAKAIDLQFINAYKANAQQAFFNYLHADACINLKNAILQQGKEQWSQAISSVPPTLIMEPIASGISTTGDVAYVYGSVTYEGKKENYLRVWQHTVQGWKIILQTLTW